jgi:hypothetical protein
VGTAEGVKHSRSSGVQVVSIIDLITFFRLPQVTDNLPFAAKHLQFLSLSRFPSSVSACRGSTN